MRTASLRPAGYSLVELLAVLALLGVLAAAVLPLAEVALQRERERELRRALWEIRDAIDAYKRASDAGLIVAVGSGYPPSLDALTTGVASARGGERHHFLRRIPRDPFAPWGVEPRLQWGLRSYASPALKPEAGSDVYDVYSRSERIGLDGVPLRQW